MSIELTLTLRDELELYLQSLCGEGKQYATPSELIVQVLQQKKLDSDAQAARGAIIAGYRDAIAGRLVRFEGSLRKLLDPVDT